MASIEDILFLHKREIAGMIPDVIVQERHEDELIITEHPVERGSVISDHAYLRPAELELTTVWKTGFNPIGDILFGAPVGKAEDAYEAMRRVQASKELISIVAGKRSYEDMLIQKIVVTTEEDSENILDMRITLRQVILVDSQVRTLDTTDTVDYTKGQNNVNRKGTKQARQPTVGYQGVP